MNLRGLHLHVDAPCGAAGDMMLGALLDLGVPLDVIGAALDAIGAGRHRLHATRVVKHGIAATDVKVDTSGSLPPPAPRMGGPGPAPGPGADSEATRMAVVPADLAEDLVEATEMGAPPRPPPLPQREPKMEAPGFTPGDGTERTVALRLEDLEALVEKTSEPEHRSHPHARPRLHVHSHASATHTHDHPEDHVHAPAAHAHHRYRDIRNRIDGAPLTEGTKRRALDIFDRIARAEAKLHGTSVDAVSFHEVGAIDSVVDVVGTAAALDYLAPAEVTCTSVAMGHGTITCAHGVLPVPAPAALEVLREAGGVMSDGGVARELCTPTGAAILAHAVTRWTAAPTGKPVGTGWGSGDADLADRANVLRVVALEVAARATDVVWQIEANLDDMSPELCAPAADAVFAAGALDVWWSPITMKKGRPALALAALATEERRAAVIAAILRETTTIGVRYRQVERTVLERRTVEVATRYGTIPIKVASEGDAVLNAAPEYEACAAAAKQHGVPVKLVFAAALAAFDRA